MEIPQTHQDINNNPPAPGCSYILDIHPGAYAICKSSPTHEPEIAYELFISINS